MSPGRNSCCDWLESLALWLDESLLSLDDSDVLDDDELALLSLDVLSELPLEPEMLELLLLLDVELLDDEPELTDVLLEELDTLVLLDDELSDDALLRLVELLDELLLLLSDVLLELDSELTDDDVLSVESLDCGSLWLLELDALDWLVELDELLFDVLDELLD